jgi:excisionase family DNA binding protein
MADNGISLSEPGILEKLNRSGRALKVRQVADMLGVAGSTIYKWTREGTIPSVRIGRCVRFDGPALARHLRRTQ